MQLDVISPVFLVLAIGLSWSRFVSIFSTLPSAALAGAPLNTAATGISLSALAFAPVP